jgi:hypothetical protein
VLATIFAAAVFVVFVTPVCGCDARPLAADDVHTREGRQGHEEGNEGQACGPVAMLAPGFYMLLDNLRGHYPAGAAIAIVVG